MCLLVFVNNIGSECGINFFDRFIFDDSDPNFVDTLSFYELDVVKLQHMVQKV